MARSAARMRSLQRTCELVHDRAFTPQKYPAVPLIPARRTPAVSATTGKSHKEWLEDHFRQSVQKEFARLGIA